MRMISKKTYIAKLENEIRILKHLASKATTPELLNFKFSDKQRTTAQWFAYLALVWVAGTKDIINDDASGFEMFADSIESFDMKDFSTIMDKNLSDMVAIIESATEEKLAEEKIMFGRFTDTRASHMLSLVYNWHVAYKTQIFLQLKAAGLTDIGTMNLWGWMDAPTA